MSVFRELLGNAGPAHDWIGGKGLDETEGREKRLQNERREELMKVLPQVFAAPTAPTAPTANG